MVDDCAKAAPTACRSRLSEMSGVVAVTLVVVVIVFARGAITDVL